MKRKVIYYRGSVDFDGNNGEIKDIIGSIIGKDYEWYLVETFNNIGSDAQTIRSSWMDTSKNPPKLKKKGKYVWITDSFQESIKHIGIQTR